MTIAELVDAFHAYNARHKSPKTVRFYQSRLKLFRAKFSDRDATTLKPLEIDAWLDEAGKNAAGEPLSDSTRRHNAVALTTLQSFARSQKLLKKRWFQKLDKPRMGRRERLPTPDEVARLLAGANSAFRLIYVALQQCGGRPGELCAAQISDCIWDERPRIELKAHKTAKKTGEKRVIPLGPVFAPTVRLAIGERPAGPIFLSQNGKAWSVGHLSSMHRALRDKAGLDKAIVLYCTRHGFVTGLLAAGVPIADASLLAGHKNIATTMIYVHRDATDVASSQGRLPATPPPVPKPPDPEIPTAPPRE